MVVQHNLVAMNAQRQFGITDKSKAKSTEKLSSGFRINRAADDAAGLAISEKMRRQIRGLTQASSNAQDGISMVQTAEGGLGEVHDMIQRMNELSVKAANGTLTSDDRSYVDAEFQSLKKEINRVANSTTFNEIQLFPPDGSTITTSSYDIHVNADGTYTMTMAANDVYSVGETTSTDNATATANYLASLIPSTIDDILNEFPSLDNVGDLEVKLDLSYIDGANGTLAYASYRYYTNNYQAVPNSFLVKVDTADFTDSNALSGGDRNDLLKATLRHELTHTIMQHTLTKGMASGDIPQWFSEGSAQAVGGGFSTGWLGELAYLTNGLSAGDTSKDAQIEAYLKKYTVDGRPYGHGYLATMYAGYLAGGNDINNIAAGLNSIMAQMKAGNNFETAIQNATGKSVTEIKNAINKGTADGVAFARELSIATGSGAGSAVFGLANGSQQMGTIPADASGSGNITAADSVILQVGSEAGVEIELHLFSIGTKSLGLDVANVLTAEDAKDAITSAKNALNVVSSIRSYYGATQNRLEHTIKNLDNVVENTTSAESAIRDTDMAKEMVSMSMLNILSQAGVSMMTQANQANQTVLSLLQ